MSFTDLKITDLKKISESFGVDISDVKGKREIIARMEEEGVTYQMYNGISNMEREEVEAPKTTLSKKERVLNKSKTLLVKMDRQNLSYSSGGHTFTREHPFVPMTEQDAQDLFDRHPGFRLATPRELQEYYA